jgi:hypothetical protein
MKPINEMSLKECIEAFRTGIVVNRGSVIAVNPSPNQVRKLIDRIDDLTRWIPVSERLPTEADADENGRVLWYFKDQYQQTLMRDMPRWKMSYERVTHWRRSDNPEGV